MRKTKLPPSWRKRKLNSNRHFIAYISLILALIPMLAVFADLHANGSSLSPIEERQAEVIEVGNSAMIDPCYLPQVFCPQETEASEDTLKSPQITGVIREVSAYTSRIEETDDTPCIPAANFNFCEIGPEEFGVDYYVASNAFPLYTELEIEHLGTAIVVDRMNKRYSENVDIYMENDIERALNFGRQNLLVNKL